MNINVDIKDALEVGGFIAGLIGVYLRMDRRLTRVETQIELYWGGIQKKLGEVIKQPIHHRKDWLIDHFPNLKDAELSELHEIIQEEYETLKKTKDPGYFGPAVYLQGIELEEHRRAERKKKWWYRLFCKEG